MTLPAVVASMDEVPEEAREHYRESDDGGFALAVDGVKEHPKVTALSKAYESEKDKRKSLSEKLRSFGDVTPDDVESLREELAEAREGGDVDVEAKIEEVKEKLAEKHEAEKQEIRDENESLRGDLHQLLVDNQLNQAIEEAGIKPEFRPAVRAMLKEREPTLVEKDGQRVGVFKESPDGIPGDHRIDEFVDQWAETEDAKPYLPASNKSGSGSEPGGSGGGSGGTPATAKIEGGIVRTDPAKVASGEVAISE